MIHRAVARIRLAALPRFGDARARSRQVARLLDADFVGIDVEDCWLFVRASDQRERTMIHRAAARIWPAALPPCEV
jgi:hypothetical protein